MLLARLFSRRDSRSPRSLGPAHRPAAQRRRPSRPPHVEFLENRTLLSGWAINAGGSGRDGAYDLALDGAGNVLVTGFFFGTADFDPGPGTANLTSAGGLDVFVAKYSPTGALVWAQRAGGSLGEDFNGDFGFGIAPDGSGNLYITGAFNGSAAFGATTLSSAGGRDVFVAKLDASGNFVWAGSFGATTSSTDADKGWGIAVDAAGNVLTTGVFGGTVDFDPGPGVANLTSVGVQDIFVLKLDPSGNFVWVRRAGGASTVGHTGGDDSGRGIAVDASGNAYTTGSFANTADFDPGPGAAYLTSASTNFGDVFVSKLDASGNFAWARRMGTYIVANEGGAGVAVDAAGNVYTDGGMSFTGDFDTGAAIVNLTSNGGSGDDVFVVRTSQDVPTTPQLARLQDSPDPVVKGNTVTLKADDIRVVQGGSRVASVSFYRDKNGNGTLEVGTDTLLGTDSDGSNGWSLAVSIPKNFKTGTYTYFAQAKDSANVTGNVVSTTNTVTSGRVASMVVSRDSGLAVDRVIAAHYSNDRDDRLDLIYRLTSEHDLLARLRHARRRS